MEHGNFVTTTKFSIGIEQIGEKIQQLKARE